LQTPERLGRQAELMQQAALAGVERPLQLIDEFPHFVGRRLSSHTEIKWRTDNTRSEPRFVALHDAPPVDARRFQATRRQKIGATRWKSARLWGQSGARRGLPDLRYRLQIPAHPA